MTDKRQFKTLQPRPFGKVGRDEPYYLCPWEEHVRQDLRMFKATGPKFEDDVIVYVYAIDLRYWLDVRRAVLREIPGVVSLVTYRDAEGWTCVFDSEEPWIHHRFFERYRAAAYEEELLTAALRKAEGGESDG